MLLKQQLLTQAKAIGAIASLCSKQSSRSSSSSVHQRIRTPAAGERQCSRLAVAGGQGVALQSSMHASICLHHLNASCTQLYQLSGLVTLQILLPILHHAR
jgi:hypothetical protein